MGIKGFSSQDINASKKQGFTRLCILALLTSMTYISSAFDALAQSPVLKPAREISILAGNAFWSGINYGIQFHSPVKPGLDYKTSGLDKFAVAQFRKTPAKISDYTLIAAGLLSAAVMWNKTDEKNTMRKYTVTAQSLWLSANLTHSVKMLVLRNRPYTRESGFQFTKRDDSYSFFSGHSALAAAAVTSAWLYRRKDTPSPHGQKLLLGAAGLTACATMYLRLNSGKHYPTDILGGLLTGMGIAWINYKIHEK